MSLLCILILPKFIVGFVFILLYLFFGTMSKRITSAGFAALFVTYSADLAVGLPIVQALFPQYTAYIYLLATAQVCFVCATYIPRHIRFVQVAVVNTTWFIVLEVGKAKDPSDNGHSDLSSCSLIRSVAFGVATNPLVLFGILGMITNIAFLGGAGKAPAWLVKILKLSGGSFASGALFLLGGGMVGNMSALWGRKLIQPLFLTVGKVIYFTLSMSTGLVQWTPLSL